MKPCLRMALCVTLLMGCDTRPPVIIKQKGDPTCTYKPRYSATERRRFFPFDAADTIQLVSFRSHLEWAPVDSNRLIGDSLVECHTLTGNGIDSLSDELYNVVFTKPPNYSSMPACYQPRNAVVFLDKKGRLIAIDVLCFNCRNHEEYPKAFKFGDACDGKMERLRAFFAAEGLAYGTDTVEDRFYEDEGDSHPNTEIIIPEPKNP